MKRRLCLIVVIISILFFGNVAKSSGQDSLEPVEGFFSSPKILSDYYLQVNKTLLSGCSEMPMARIVVLPSFEPEAAISLEAAANGKYELIYSICDKQIWGNTDPASIKAHAFRKTIDPKLAVMIQDVIFSAVSMARFPGKANVTIDGTGYFFISFKEGQGSRMAKTMSPQNKTLPYRLTNLTGMLINYAKSSDSDNVRLGQHIYATTKKLLQEIARKQQG